MFLDNSPSDAHNSERALAQRPEVYATWVALNTTIKAGMDARRYELVSIATARALTSSYCALAHASVALERGLATVDELLDPASLREDARAIAAFAEQVAHDATAIDAAAVEALRAHGLSEQDITDVILATT